MLAVVIEMRGDLFTKKKRNKKSYLAPAQGGKLGIKQRR
jgi:hypothetical protein